MQVRHENVFFVAASKQNVNALMVFQFLFHMVQLFRSYFEGKCDEGTINENFSLIYELLDEAMDYGCDFVLCEGGVGGRSRVWVCFLIPF